MYDPTYVKAEIDKRPEWELAFTLSEIQNNNAPIGWGKYIFLAKMILAIYDVKKKGMK